MDSTAAKPVLVRDVDNPEARPFQRSIAYSSSGHQPKSFDVPLGRRLVIEYVSAHCADVSDDATIVNIGIKTIVDGEASNHYVPPLVGAIAHEKTVGQVMRLYADPNTSVTVDLYAASSQPTCNVSLSGHWLGGPLRLPIELP